MMTGDEYLRSLDDGRETYFEGQPVIDIAKHPLLGITVDSAAAGYDRFYDPTPGAVGAFMHVPGSAKELREQVELHETVDLLTHVTYASIMTLLTAADRIEATLPENAARIRAWVACMVPVNAPGVKIINTTYAPRHHDTRDFPISGRHHTPEGFVIFDDVFVPNERVFLDGHPELAGIFAHSLGLWERLGGLSSMATRYEALVGFAQLISEANGLDRVGHIKEKISEMLINATLIRATLEAAIENCHVTSDGAAFPDELYTNAGKYHGAANWSLMVRHLHDIGGGSILTAPGHADFENRQVGHLARKYMGTMQSVDGLYRTRLFHAIRDLTADALGGWNAVTNIQAGGGLYAQRIVSRLHYDMDRAKETALRTGHMEEFIGKV